MTQEIPFWLQVNTNYAIENFEALLDYVRRCPYNPDEPENGNFNQTYRCLKELSADISEKLNDCSLYKKPALDIPPTLALRILAATFLTGQRRDYVDYEVLIQLVSAITLMYKELTAKLKSELINIVISCARRRAIRKTGFSWTDIEAKNFSIEIFVHKFKLLEFFDKVFDTDAKIYYQGQGLVAFDRNATYVSSMNFPTFDKTTIGASLEVPQCNIKLGVDKKDSKQRISTIERLFEVYPGILGEFAQFKPSTLPKLKIYEKDEPAVVRVTFRYGHKIVAETIEPGYEKLTGNILLPSNVNHCITREKFASQINVGDYLSVDINDDTKFPFVINEAVISDFTMTYSEETVMEKPRLEAIFTDFYSDVFGKRIGSRWLTEAGLYVNILGYPLSDEIMDCINSERPCGVYLKEAKTDSSDHSIINGEFDEEYVDNNVHFDKYVFKANAIGNFIHEFIKLSRIQAPAPQKEIEKIEVDRPTVLALMRSLYYMGEMSDNSDSTMQRAIMLTLSALIATVLENANDYRYIKFQLDYLRCLTDFAHGMSPNTLKLTAPDELVGNNVVVKKCHIIESLAQYNDLRSQTVQHSSDLEDVSWRTVELVKASNILLGKIELQEVDRIKMNIADMLGVGDEYQSINKDAKFYGIESQTLEFKSSVVFPPKNRLQTSNLPDPDTQKWAIIKTVCAFLNSYSGGELIIGVNNNGIACGLNSDIAELSRLGRIKDANLDSLALYVKSMLDISFQNEDGTLSGIEISRGHIHVNAESDPDQIIRVKVEPFRYGIISIKERRPLDIEASYWRDGASSLPMTTIQQEKIINKKLSAVDDTTSKLRTIYKAINEHLVVNLLDYTSATGISTRRVEPFKVHPYDQVFMAYDLDKRAVRLFKISRAREIVLTSSKAINQRKHKASAVDIFGFCESEKMPKETVKILLSNFAKVVLCEQFPAATKLVREYHGAGYKNYPWIIETEVNNPLGLGNFLYRVQDLVKIECSEYMKSELKKQLKAAADSLI
jgi:hypothetical protein